MEEDLGRADEGESHAESEEASAVGDVRRLGDLLVLLEALGVRVLDEDVEHHQVLAGIVQDDLLDRTAGKIHRNQETWFFFLPSLFHMKDLYKEQRAPVRGE